MLFPLPVGEERKHRVAAIEHMEVIFPFVPPIPLLSQSLAKSPHTIGFFFFRGSYLSALSFQSGLSQFAFRFSLTASQSVSTHHCHRIKRSLISVVSSLPPTPLAPTRCPPLFVFHPSVFLCTLSVPLSLFLSWMRVATLLVLFSD